MYIYIYICSIKQKEEEETVYIKNTPLFLKFITFISFIKNGNQITSYRYRLTLIQR